jgi:hypothetical protein
MQHSIHPQDSGLGATPGRQRRTLDYLMNGLQPFFE